MVFQLDAATEHLQELIESRRGVPVREELLLRGLAKPLVEDAKLEVGHDDVLVVGGDQLGGPRAQHRGQALDRQAVVQDLRTRQRQRTPLVAISSRAKV